MKTRAYWLLNINSDMNNDISIVKRLEMVYRADNQFSSKHESPGRVNADFPNKLCMLNVLHDISNTTCYS